MDADWSVEIGEGLPSINVPWEGWVDLRGLEGAERVRVLSEVQAYPELAEVLIEINTRHPSAVTSKCDVFSIDMESTRPAMLDAEPDQELQCGLGSYIDLAFVHEFRADFAWWESLVRYVAPELLAPIHMPGASVELVIREGSYFSRQGYGLTLYAMGFGPDPPAAREAWAKVMRLAASITMVEVSSRKAQARP